MPATRSGSTPICCGTDYLDDPAAFIDRVTGGVTSCLVNP
jgi:hypothetical protein